MKAMGHTPTNHPASTDSTETANTSQTSKTGNELHIESMELPGLDFGWPQWLYRHLRELLKRPTPSH